MAELAEARVNSAQSECCAAIFTHAVVLHDRKLMFAGARSLAPPG